MTGIEAIVVNARRCGSDLARPEVHQRPGVHQQSRPPAAGSDDRGWRGLGGVRSRLLAACVSPARGSRTLSWSHRCRLAPQLAGSVAVDVLPRKGGDPLPYLLAGARGGL